MPLLDEEVWDDMNYQQQMYRYHCYHPNTPFLTYYYCTPLSSQVRGVPKLREFSKHLFGADDNTNPDLVSLT